MVYGKNRKKYTRKYTKTLKKSNIFKNKSAKSQAKQIYKLNKKVNHIQKLTAPEIQRLQDNIYNINFVDGGGNILVHSNDAVPLFKNYLLDTTKTKHIDLKGCMLRFRYLEIYGLFGCFNDTSLEGDWTISTSKRLIERQPFTAYMRIIIARVKNSTQLVPPKITQAPDQTFNNVNIYDIKPIYGPLIDDVTSNLEIIKNKVIKVNTSNPMKAYKIRLSPKKLGYIYRESADGITLDSVGKNEIVIYTQYVCPNVLRFESPQTQTYKNVGPVCRLTMNYNFGYIDQN